MYVCKRIYLCTWRCKSICNLHVRWLVSVGMLAQFSTFRNKSKDVFINSSLCQLFESNTQSITIEVVIFRKTEKITMTFLMTFRLCFKLRFSHSRLVEQRNIRRLDQIHTHGTTTNKICKWSCAIDEVSRANERCLIKEPRAKGNIWLTSLVQLSRKHVQLCSDISQHFSISKYV